MHPNQLAEYRELKDHGVEVTKTNSIEFNAGSEISAHVVAKALVGHLGVSNGYRVASETQCVNGEIDVCLWGHPDRLSYAVELEHSPTDDVVESKLQRYVHETPLDDMILLNLNDMPQRRLDALEWISKQIGLDA